jgi:hypothetical protein
MLLRLLHRIVESLLHFERRLEQPFLRPAFNYVLREPLARLLTALINLQRSRENVGLAEETPQPGEDEDVQTMIDEMRRHLVRDFPPGGFERAGNTKTHGLRRRKTHRNGFEIAGACVAQAARCCSRSRISSLGLTSCERL